MEKRIQERDEQMKLFLHYSENGYSSDKDTSHNAPKKIKKKDEDKKAQEIFATSTIDEKEREKRKIQERDDQMKLFLYYSDNGYSSDKDTSHNAKKKIKTNEEDKKAQEIFATSTIDEKERKKRKSPDFSKFTQRRNNDLIAMLMKCEQNKNMMVKKIIKKISNNEEKTCKDVLVQCKEDCQDIVKHYQDQNKKKCFLLSKHFVRLKPKGSLWDETLNCFMVLLENVDSALCRQNPARRKSFFFCSEYFKLLV